ncbi:MAG: IS66 family insertion sequence element accessory protein TnpB [Mediterranea sp.]|jgi:putative transposase|nr:IS66 family insertion sequence element accessory protein TnpB [Mediterranea sp.]
MNKEEFIKILSRQMASGLTIRDFCQNEVYPESSFHYWKSKYGLTRSMQRRQPMAEDANGSFAPVSFPSPATSSGSGSLSGGGRGRESELVVELPEGVKIRFSGDTSSSIAIELFSQILRSHVLPE